MEKLTDQERETAIIEAGDRMLQEYRDGNREAAIQWMEAKHRLIAGRSETVRNALDSARMVRVAA